MSQLAPVMLTAEQFSQLATKAYLDKTLDEKLKHFATKDDLKNFATKEDLIFRFGQLNYKIDTSFKDVNDRLEKIEKKLDRHEKDINELNLFTVDHAMRIKKLEFRAFWNILPEPLIAVDILSAAML